MVTFKEAEEVYDLVEDLLSSGSRGIILEIFISPDGCKSAAVKWINHRDSASSTMLGNGVWIEDCFNLKLISSGKRNESRNN